MVECVFHTSYVERAFTAIESCRVVLIPAHARVVRRTTVTWRSRRPADWVLREMVLFDD